eukprot:TRINITY_DN9789_c0_g1::TRINITY_DN9789_c0_g1_i1::g.4878::m.4878 TRINITY_DN9789_c0_g1::TRINITY_DN9789_c0_g1_i1::g.4878  ORF type:complete len:170 (+),score=35.16,sp/Q8VD57/SFT2B_MOUSE/41.14/2e-28,Got1/PF04178.7/4.1e-24,Bax1-I/PF01027.15/0.025,ABC2_membrane_5/PF13346.1/0.19,DUF4133/PF13571.1/2.5e+03,DUF4133/PF13571.1/0.071,PGG/PF13962.1/0.21,PGG/PF13962.1/1.2e+02,PGG/PF13962.1/9.8e+02,DUF2207/PF09972.4/77 TRINITY_DN9789_c0_g1_i1:119-628(+)
MANTFQKLKREVGLDNSDPSWTEELDDMVSLSKKQRVYGFVGCMALGFIFSCIGTIFLIQLITGNPIPFAFCYTIGNLLSLGSSFFLVGPFKQVQRMVEKTRILATFVYFFAMGLTLYLAIKQPLPTTGANAIVIILLIIVQAMAMFWYTLSYIPYARQCVKTTIKNMV